MTNPEGGSVDEIITTSVRIEKRRADQVAKIAEVEQTSIAEEIRAAIAMYVEAKRKDAEFQRRLKAAIAQANEVFGELSAEP